MADATVKTMNDTIGSAMAISTITRAAMPTRLRWRLGTTGAVMW